MDLDLFAEYFTTHLPITALVYDNRCVGSSDGLPRGELLPHYQISDLQDSITFAQTLEEVNPDKIGIWGTSYSGANVLYVGAFDKRVKCVITQNPMVDGWENSQRLCPAPVIPQMNKMFAAGIKPSPVKETNHRPIGTNERGGAWCFTRRHE